MSKKLNRRLEHKGLRQAERRALDGAAPSRPRSMNYNSSVKGTDVPLINDVMPHRSKGGGGCKRAKGKPHDVEYRDRREFIWVEDENGRSHLKLVGPSWGQYKKVGYFCKRCNKRLWGYRPPSHEGHLPAE